MMMMLSMGSQTAAAAASVIIGTIIDAVEVALPMP
jgi:hypothetical protein